MNHHTSAGIIAYHQENGTVFYLLLHYQAGHWDFAKGHLDPGETIQEAAHRELMEETGLTAVLDKKFNHSFSYNFIDHDQQPAIKTVTFFVGEVVDRDVVVSHEHQDFVWLPYQEARVKLTYKNAQEMLDAADYYIKNNRDYSS